MLFIAIGSLATAGSFIFILYSLSPKLLRAVLGYRVWADILLSGSLTIMGLMTGTISGLVIGSLSAIAMTLALVFMKKLVGYRKYVKNPTTGKREWVEFEGTMSSASIGTSVRDVAVKVINCVKGFGSGLSRSKVTA